LNKSLSQFYSAHSPLTNNNVLNDEVLNQRLSLTALHQKRGVTPQK